MILSYIEILKQFTAILISSPRSQLAGVKVLSGVLRPGGSCLMVVVSHGNLLLSPTTHLQPSNRGLSPGSPSVPGRTPGLAHHHQSDNTDMNTPSDNQNLPPECDL